MTATISSPLEVKRALLADARLAITDPVVTVRTGHPGTYQPGDLVSFTDLELSEGFGPMGNRRQRDVEVRVTMVVSIIRGGGEDQEEVAEDRCW